MRSTLQCGISVLSAERCWRVRGSGVAVSRHFFFGHSEETFSFASLRKKKNFAEVFFLAVEAFLGRVAVLYSVVPAQDPQRRMIRYTNEASAGSSRDSEV